MFYGWVIVGLAFVAQFVAVGAMIQSFPVFLLPLSEEFEIGRAQVSLIPVALMLCGVVVSPFVGRAVARYPIRNVMIFGSCALGLGFLVLSRATAFWHVALTYGISGSLGLGAVGIISCNSLIVNWFERRRAMALGMAMLGMSLSGAVMIPIVSWALAEWGWRSVYLGFAVAHFSLIPLIAWLVVTRPEDIGLAADGRTPHPSSASGRLSGAVVRETAGTREILATPNLWLIAAACGLCFLGSSGIMSHGIAFAIERGIDPMGAAGLLAAISIGAACGKVLFGWLPQRLGERGAFGVAIALQLVALFGFIFQSSYTALIGTAGFYGLGLGGVTPLQAALLARTFGLKSFAPAMGLIGPVTIPFQIIGPPLAGFIFDTRGSYEPALWIFVATTACAAPALAMIRTTTGPRLARPEPSAA